MITSYQTTRLGNVTTVTVTSDLPGTVYFHWYIDGSHVASTSVPTYAFYLADGGQVRIEVLDTNNSAFDPIANAPDGWPSWRSLWWIRSLDTDVDHYRVEQKLGAGEWTALGQIHAVTGQWDYSYQTGQLTDLATYLWRVVPVDTAGNDGTAVAIDSETVVRTPDAPNFAIAFDEGTTKVTFATAS